MKKDLLIPVSPSVQAYSHFSMKLISPLSYIKKTENYMKRKIKIYTKKNKNWPKIYLCFLVFAFEIAGIYRRNAEGRRV